MAHTPEIDNRKNSSKNYIINSNFDIWQRSTSLSVGPANQAYVADRWKVVGPGSAAVVTASQSSSVPTFSESGFNSSFSHDINVTTIDAAATNYYLSYRLEGYDFAALHKKKVTLSFWILATRTGTSCVTFNNSADNRGYPVEFTINNTLTWEKKEITITLDQAGTWLLDNGQGMNVRFVLNTAVAQQGTANVWQAGAVYGTANQINHLNTVGNRYRIAQVQLVEGGEALPFRTFAADFGREFAACSRYYQVLNRALCYTDNTTLTAAKFSGPFPVEMRTTPAILVAASGITSVNMHVNAAGPTAISVGPTANSKGFTPESFATLGAGSATASNFTFINALSADAEL